MQQCRTYNRKPTSKHKTSLPGYNHKKKMKMANLGNKNTKMVKIYHKKRFEMTSHIAPNFSFQSHCLVCKVENVYFDTFKSAFHSNKNHRFYASYNAVPLYQNML